MGKGYSDRESHYTCTANTAAGGIIHIGSGITIDNRADITATGVSLTLFCVASGGKLSISNNGMASVTSENGVAIYNQGNGTVNIYDGTVMASNSRVTAIYNNSTGTINISEGNVVISGNSSNAVYMTDIGTLNISGGRVSADGDYSRAILTYGATINISGGDVQSYGFSSFAVFNNRTAITNKTHKTIDIKGGMILANHGHAVSSEWSSGSANISNNAILFAYGANDRDVIEGPYTRSGNAVIAAWNRPAGVTAYVEGSSGDIYQLPEMADVVWGRRGTDIGISVSYGSTYGFIVIDDVNLKVVPTAIETIGQEPLQIYPNPTDGELEIRNFESAIESVEIFDITGKKQPFSMTKSQSLIQIHISHLPAGIYLLRATNVGGKVQSVRVVKK